jgi:DNA polymerase III delta prime subunit
MNEIDSTLLINKYKPRSFEDFEYTCNIVPILRHHISKDLVHILIVGHEGSGKTALTDVIVSEYYGDCDANICQSNTLHITALHEHGINYFRTDLKHFCQTGSLIPAKKKVLILDNLDDIPESHQYIVASMIDKYKTKINVIATCRTITTIALQIQSRLMMVAMPLVSIEYLHTITNRIMKTTPMLIDVDAIHKIICLSNLRINQLIQNLEKVRLFNGQVTTELVDKLCVHMNFKQFDIYIEYLKEGHLIPAINELYTIHEQGFSVIDIMDYFFKFVKTTDNIIEPKKYEVIQLICKHIDLFYTVHEDEIELAIFTHKMLAILCNQHSTVASR